MPLVPRETRSKMTARTLSGRSSNVVLVPGEGDVTRDIYKSLRSLETTGSCALVALTRSPDAQAFKSTK